MQHILSDEELQALSKAAFEAKAEIEKQTKATVAIYQEIVQELCKKVANHMPVIFWDNERAAPWTCSLDRNDWYCDECPVKGLCPCDHKKWSK